MPSGAKKRKAAQKKKLNNNNNNNSSSSNPHQEVEVLKKEDSTSENQSKDLNEGNVEIEETSKSKTSSSSSSSSSGESSDDESRVADKNIVVVESAAVESVPEVESAPIESIPDVECVSETISPIVESVKPVDSLLEEVSQVFDEIKNEKKTDVVVEEPTAVIKEDLPTSSAVAETVNGSEVEETPVTDYVPSSTPPTNLITEVNGADCENETGTVEQSNKQDPAASSAVVVQGTSTWKSCCGLFELFSRSER